MIYRFFIFAITLFCDTQAFAASKEALLIGSAEYSGSGTPLRNPINDRFRNGVPS
ncbi:hypothetical protein GGD46_004369 [Rhizobium lusitanum]|uniref:Uncharacterized protein n=1 Tax=Rhizobium lusitanum TaxID=293958 RepID=A0A7X0IU06_9HYPH|nr:hypothetical protein [Rhizobium lusitanum]